MCEQALFEALLIQEDLLACIDRHEQAKLQVSEEFILFQWHHWQEGNVHS